MGRQPRLQTPGSAAVTTRPGGGFWETPGTVAGSVPGDIRLSRRPAAAYVSPRPALSAGRFPAPPP